MIHFFKDSSLINSGSKICIILAYNLISLRQSLSLLLNRFTIPLSIHMLIITLDIS